LSILIGTSKISNFSYQQSILRNVAANSTLSASEVKPHCLSPSKESDLVYKSSWFDHRIEAARANWPLGLLKDW